VLGLFSTRFIVEALAAVTWTLVALYSSQKGYDPIRMS